MNPRRILCAVDFGDPSQEARSAGVEMARRFGAALSLVHVVELPIYAAPDGALVPDAVAIEQTKRIAEERLGSWAEEARRAGVERVDALVLSGSAWRDVVNLAERLLADLIVVGTHGRTGMRHLLLGSVAERIVRHAPCAVLVARQRGEATGIARA